MPLLESLPIDLNESNSYEGRKEGNFPKTRKQLYINDIKRYASYGHTIGAGIGSVIGSGLGTLLGYVVGLIPGSIFGGLLGGLVFSRVDEETKKESLEKIRDSLKDAFNEINNNSKLSIFNNFINADYASLNFKSMVGSVSTGAILGSFVGPIIGGAVGGFISGVVLGSIGKLTGGLLGVIGGLKSVILSNNKLDNKSSVSPIQNPNKNKSSTSSIFNRIGSSLKDSYQKIESYVSHIGVSKKKEDLSNLPSSQSKISVPCNSEKKYGQENNGIQTFHKKR